MSGPPELPGLAAAEKRSHFHAPFSSSKVWLVKRPLRIMIPSPSALPTEKVCVFKAASVFAESPLLFCV